MECDGRIIFDEVAVKYAAGLRKSRVIECFAGLDRWMGVL